MFNFLFLPKLNTTNSAEENVLDNTPNKWLYIFKAYALLFPIAIAVAFLVDAFFPNAEEPIIHLDVWSFFFIVIVSPLLETLMMVAIFWFLNKLTNSLLIKCLVSALIWAVLHSLSYPMHGVVIFFSFFIFSIAFLEWQKKSTLHAFEVTTYIHLLNNLSVFTILLFFPE